GRGSSPTRRLCKNSRFITFPFCAMLFTGSPPLRRPFLRPGQSNLYKNPSKGGVFIRLKPACRRCQFRTGLVYIRYFPDPPGIVTAEIIEAPHPKPPLPKGGASACRGGGIPQAKP